MLLEASAGTGKTYTITGLILRLVAEYGVNLEKILVVTFTRAAAAELRGRVRSRLTGAIGVFERALTEGWSESEADVQVEDEVAAHLLKEAMEDGGEELENRLRRLRDAGEGFDTATIDTIHGFCQQTLQRAAPDVDLEMGAELVEDLGGLVDEVVQDALVRELRHAEEEWYRFLRSQKIDAPRLRAIARRLEEEPYLQVLPDRPEFRQKDPAELWEERLKRFKNTWKEQGDELAQWLAAHAKGFDGNYYNSKRPYKEATAISEWCEKPPPAIGDLDGIQKQLVYVSRAQMEEKLLDPAAMPGLSVIDAADELLAAPADLATQFLLRFAAHVREELPRRKSARGILSFTDLLLALERALSEDGTREAVRAGIRERFDVALIDEFQDTDPVQWSIFESVFGREGRLHLVGDPKQAIYGFRGADVQTYLRASRTVDDDKHFTLLVNYRSDQRYLNALNALFGREGAFEPDGVFAVQGIDHVEVQAAEAHKDDRLSFADGPRPALELRYVPRKLALPQEDADGDKLIPKEWAGRHLPRVVAEEIAGFLNATPLLHPDEGASRPAAPGDVAVLVRTNDQARSIQTELQSVGVPAVVGSTGSVFETPEAAAMQRLLDALLQPSSDDKVRPALAGPILGWRASDLVSPDEELWNSWLEKLERWVSRWRHDGVAAMLRDALAEAGTAPRLLGQPRGERTLTNLLHLGELLHGAESADRLGTEGLTVWLGQQRRAERHSGEELELRLESDAEAVTVVTVHRSKGLQYPVVWCSFLWDGRLLSNEDKRAPRFHDPATGHLSLDLNAAKDADKTSNVRRAEREHWQENLRLLYVALTRARHRCVVHTGPFSGTGTSPLYRLLHGVDFADGASAPPPDPEGRPDEDLLQELRTLSKGAIAVSEVEPPGGALRWEPPESVDVDLTVRELHRELETTWRRTSFTQLVSGEGDDEAPQDEGHDTGDEPDETLEHGTSQPDAEEVPLAKFPRGAGPGTFLHKVLEEIDFKSGGDEDELKKKVDEQLRRFSLGYVHKPTLISGLGKVMNTSLGPLADDRRLSSLDNEDRLNELDFDLPLAGGYGGSGAALTLQRIADVFDVHADDSTAPLGEYARRLRQRPAFQARGFLTGTIDLVARLDGRYGILDYKSNWLTGSAAGPAGSRLSVSADYHPARLADEMVAHDYVLQYHLYTVALHRFLSWRLGNHYDYDRDVYGVHYLFLRGMTGPETPCADDGTPYGVYAARPSPQLVEDLDAVLRGETP
jgi:exodeoxyribonuclease V beta subunit